MEAVFHTLLHIVISGVGIVLLTVLYTAISVQGTGGPYFPVYNFHRLGNDGPYCLI